MTQNIGTDGQSHQGYCGLAEESSYGGGAAPSVYLPIVSDGFSAENGVLFNSNIRGRSRFDGTAGVFDDGGSIEQVSGPENGLGHLLKGAFGTTSVSTASEGSGTDNVGTHTFTTDDKLPSYAVEIGLGAIDAARHRGVGIDSLEFSHTPEEYLMLSADMTAKDFELQGSQASPTYSDLRPFVWHDGVVTVDGSDRSVDVAEFTATVENDIDEKIRGSRTPDKAHVGTRTVSGSLNLDFENIDVLEMFLGGAAGSGTSTPQDSLYKASLNAAWTSPETVIDGGTSQYKLELDFPNITLSTHEAQVNEQDAIIENVEFDAEDTASTYDVQATLVNGQTTAY
jgi:hypothetical protein